MVQQNILVYAQLYFDATDLAHSVSIEPNDYEMVK